MNDDLTPVTDGNNELAAESEAVNDNPNQLLTQNDASAADESEQVSSCPPANPPAPVPAAATKANAEQPARSAAPREEKPAAKSSKVKRAKAGCKYTFFVGPGNNGELVRATIERRPWWELGKEDDPELNLKWLQALRRARPRGGSAARPRRRRAAPRAPQVRNRAAAEWVRRMGNQQFMNHLDGLTCIGRKNELYSNLKARRRPRRLRQSRLQRWL